MYTVTRCAARKPIRSIECDARVPRKNSYSSHRVLAELLCYRAPSGPPRDPRPAKFDKFDKIRTRSQAITRITISTAVSGMISTVSTRIGYRRAKRSGCKKKKNATTGTNINI